MSVGATPWWEQHLVKHGLGQVDLNLLVRMSLAGLIDAPEHHLSNLLRSSQPIEAHTWQTLADALDGRLTGVSIRITQTKQASFVRKFRWARHKIQIGHRVSEKMDQEGLTYDKAVEQIAPTCGRSEKWVQGCHTEANKLWRWIEECQDRGLNHSKAALEMAFIYSKLKGLDPGESLKPTIELLAEIILKFEAGVIDATGHPRQAPRAMRKSP